MLSVDSCGATSADLSILSVSFGFLILLESGEKGSGIRGEQHSLKFEPSAVLAR